MLERAGSVALYMGAWIETYLCQCYLYHFWGRTLYGCVDWNWKVIVPLAISSSRTLYGCVDWNNAQEAAKNRDWRRTLYGCVDWNWYRFRWFAYFRVALYMGAWIETAFKNATYTAIKVALYMGAWIETCCACARFRAYAVALYMGAWIETQIYRNILNV